MGKAPAFQFYPGDWRRDTQVQMASMETRGVWIEMLCCMWDAPNRGKLHGNLQCLSRLLGCETNVLIRALVEIERYKIGDVTQCNNSVTVINRRMFREEKDREKTRLRVRRHRKTQGTKGTSNESVTPPSSSSPSSSTLEQLKKHEPFQLPTKEEIGEASLPRLKILIGETCKDLYECGVFPKSNAFANKCLKYKSNARAILHTLVRISTAKPNKPWAYAVKIMAVEDANFNERDFNKTT